MTTATSSSQAYRTLDGGSLYLTGLSGKEQRVLAEIQRAYGRNPDWASFANFWREKMRDLYKNLPSKARTAQPLYLIGEDLEARLGVSQGHVRAPDLRDELRQLIDDNFRSRYAFCRATGLDQGFVSRLLRKLSGISVQRLNEALHRIGWKLTLTKLAEGKEKAAKPRTAPK